MQRKLIIRMGMERSGTTWLDSAPPQPRELRSALAALSAKTWRHLTTGVALTFSVSA